MSCLDNLYNYLDLWFCFCQVSCFNAKSSTAAHTHSKTENKLSPFATTFLSDSLLDIVEMQGTAGGRGMQVQVVVQRVYYLPAKEGFRCYLQGNNPAPNTTSLLNSDLPNVRWVIELGPVWHAVLFFVVLSLMMPNYRWWVLVKILMSKISTNQYLRSCSLTCQIF